LITLAQHIRLFVGRLTPKQYSKQKKIATRLKCVLLGMGWYNKISKYQIDIFYCIV